MQREIPIGQSNSIVFKMKQNCVVIFLKPRKISFSDAGQPLSTFHFKKTTLELCGRKAITLDNQMVQIIKSWFTEDQVIGFLLCSSEIL